MTRCKWPILSCAFLWAVLSGFPAAAQPTRINAGYTAGNDFLPAFVAKDKGFFEKRNLDVTLTRIQIASNVPPALVSGSLQIGMGTVPMLLQTAEGGLGIVAVSGVSRMLKASPFMSVVARAGRERVERR